MRRPNPNYDFFIIGDHLSNDEIKALRRLNEMGWLGSIRLYASHHKSLHWLENEQAALLRGKILPISRPTPVANGPLMNLALDLGWLSGQAPSPDRKRVIVLPQRTRVVFQEWAQREEQQWIVLPVLCEAAIDSLLQEYVIYYDRATIRIGRALSKTDPDHKVSLALWSQTLIEKYPELTSASARQSLFGRRKFSEYLQLLGAKAIEDNVFHFERPKCLRPRPTLDGLRDMYQVIARKRRKVLFLQWNNYVLTHWPALQSPEVRKWLFGTPSMEGLAAAAGLQRRKQLLFLTDETTEPVNEVADAY